MPNLCPWPLFASPMLKPRVPANKPFLDAEAYHQHDLMLNPDEPYTVLNDWP